MKKLELAKNHIKIKEYLEAKEILEELYNQNSFDINVLELLLEVYFQLTNNGEEDNTQNFTIIYERVKKLNENEQYTQILDNYNDIYEAYLLINEEENELASLILDINLKLSKWRIAGDISANKYKENKALNNIIFKCLNLDLPKKRNFLKESRISDIVKINPDGSAEIKYRFGGDTIDHSFSASSSDGKKYDISYTTRDNYEYSIYTFNNKKSDIEYEEIYNNLINLRDTLEKSTRSRKIDNKLFSIFRVLIYIILIAIAIFVFTQDIVIGMITVIINLLIITFLSWL